MLVATEAQGSAVRARTSSSMKDVLPGNTWLQADSARTSINQQEGREGETKTIHQDTTVATNVTKTRRSMRLQEIGGSLLREVKVTSLMRCRGTTGLHAGGRCWVLALLQRMKNFLPTFFHQASHILEKECRQMLSDI